jgi:hypothetical protein
MAWAAALLQQFSHRVIPGRNGADPARILDLLQIW